MTNQVAADDTDGVRSGLNALKRLNRLDAPSPIGDACVAGFIDRFFTCLARSPRYSQPLSGSRLSATHFISRREQRRAGSRILSQPRLLPGDAATAFALVDPLRKVRLRVVPSSVTPVIGCYTMSVPAVTLDNLSEYALEMSWNRSYRVPRPEHCLKRACLTAWASEDSVWRWKRVYLQRKRKRSEDRVTTLEGAAKTSQPAQHRDHSLKALSSLTAFLSDLRHMCACALTLSPWVTDANAYETFDTQGFRKDLEVGKDAITGGYLSAPLARPENASRHASFCRQLRRHLLI